MKKKEDPADDRKKIESKPRRKPRTKPEKQLGMTPKEGADDDNPAM